MAAGVPSDAGESRLALSSASKTFGNVTVLHDVDVEIRVGEIHGLVGQNGSGKSTLIRLLSGYYGADAGAQLRIDGDIVPFPLKPRILAQHGISFVHQNLGLDFDASVIENVRIGRFRTGRVSRRILWREEADRVAATLAMLGADTVDPYALVGTLNHAQRASVAIARAIQGTDPGSGLIVFDESTQSLPRDVLAGFFEQVRGLAAAGTSVLIVSHRLDEVLALCHRVTVLEDGREIISGQATAGLGEAELARLILGNSAAGREVAAGSIVGERRAPGDVLLRVDGLAGHRLRDASFEVRSGEIVGVIGDDDSGYDQIPALLAGARRASGGSVTIGSAEIAGTRINPRSTMAHGLCLVPADRAGQGLATGLSALDNLTLPRMTTGHSPFYLRRGWQIEEFARSVKRLGLTPGDPYLHAGSFSGGNQQKLLLSKWLESSPSVLALHEPTQAVDVGARAEILAALREQADAGVAVLITSIETQDLALVCDRVLVLHDGVITRELSGDEIDPGRILDAVYPAVVPTSKKEPSHVPV